MKNAVLIIGATLAMGTYAPEAKAQYEAEIASICIQCCFACCCGVTPQLSTLNNPGPAIDSFQRGIQALALQDKVRSVHGRQAQPEVAPSDLPPPRRRQVAVLRRREALVY